MKYLSNTPLPDQSAGNISTSSGSMAISNLSSKNVQIAFNPKSNSIRLDISNTTVKVQNKWRFYQKSKSFSGSATATGPISKIGMDIVFGT